ncbi:MAG TPA: iron-sulfur cluster repair di-iron protein [Blastocatellia bacterium]|nr:iron-sulfur cluster repair di-iron protein [Blastocatellia bacterium]
MSVSATSTVKEIAIQVPGATRVFEKLGIDYCCGGGRTLEAACSAAGLTAGEVVRSLESQATPKTSETEAKNWPGQPLGSLINFIVEKHHVFTTEEMDRIEPLIAKVLSVHGARHPELAEIETLFASLKDDLTLHMRKEERILFPYIVELEAAKLNGLPGPSPVFGTVKNPVRMMRLEHDTAGEILHKIRERSSGFTVPADGCISFKTLYGALQGLEQDLHQHIHLENNILFPRAELIEEG